MYLIDYKDKNRIYKLADESCFVLSLPSGQWEKAELRVPVNEMSEISEEQVSMYLSALETARTAHKGQKDKGGNDYITHPVTVSSLTQGSFDAVTAALLHDVIEDTDVTPQDLRAKGMNESVLACVDCLTHRKNEARADYIERIARNYDAVCVKLADLTHNSDLSRINDPQEKDYARIEKYRAEYAYLSDVKKRMEKGSHNDA